MYSLKEERISQLTPFSVLADNKRIRNKIIEGKSFQATRSGKNLLNINLMRNSNVIIENNGQKIKMPVATSGNGITNLNVYFYQLCPNLKVGDVVVLRFETTSKNNKYIYLDAPASYIWNVNTELTITEDILNSNFNMYGNRYSSGETEQVIITNLSVMLKSETNIEWEQYGAMPSPEFPSEIQNVVDNVNLFNLNTSTENKYLDATGNMIDSTITSTSDYIAVNSNTSYIINYGLLSTYYKIIIFYDNLKTMISHFTETNSNTNTIFTTPNNCKYIRFHYPTQNKNNIKLQKGTVATPYTEYGKGTVEIKQIGKNLFSGFVKGIALNSTTGAETTGTIKATTNYIQVDFNKNPNYYLSGLTDNLYSYVAVYNSNKEFLGRTGGLSYKNLLLTSSSFTGGTAQGTGDIAYLRITTYENEGYTTGSIDDIDNLKVQLEKGIEATEYEPYKENSYVIPTTPLRSLPNGVCDTIEEDGIHRRVGLKVLNGNTGSKITSIAVRPNCMIGNYNHPSIKKLSKDTDYGPMCNKLKASTINKTWNGTEIYAISQASNGTYLQISLPLEKFSTIDEINTWLQSNPLEINFELAEEVIEPFDEEQQAVLNSMETFEGVNHFSLEGELDTTLTFDYNPQITKEIKDAFKHRITRAYLEVAATDTASGFQINEDNYLQSLDFDDCRYVPQEGIIGSCVAKELQGKFINVDSSLDIENKEVECFIGAETKDEVTHYLKLGTFIVQKPENDNVKDNTTFNALDYMVKFNKQYVHRMAKYFKTEDTDIIQDKKYYILNENGAYEEVIVPHKEDLDTYYDLVDEFTLMQLLKDICNQCEVKLGTFNFRNADYVVQGNRFDSGVTCREVLKAIAQAAFSWARINEYNELMLDFEPSDTITEEIDYDEYYNLSFNDKYGPVNTIVMKNSQAEGENITIKNDELINAPSGKNLFNPNNIVNLALGGTILEESTYRGYYYSCKEGDIFSISRKDTTNNRFRVVFTSEKPAHLVPYFGGTDNLPNYDLSLKIENIVAPENAKYIFLYLSNQSDEIPDIQLEKHSEVTTYEEFMPTGTKELAISDNPFAYSEETRKAIIQAGEAIYGFSYAPLSVSTIGAAYLNCKDKLGVKSMQDVKLETYIFDTRISYQGNIKSDIETLAMTDTETKYQYDGSLTTAQRRTELRVDKAEQKIYSLVRTATEQGEKFTKVEQDIKGISTTISDTTGEFNDKFTKIEEDIKGISTKLTTTGGQNLIRNSVGYFGNEYWELENSDEEPKIKGNNTTEVKQNSTSGSALEIQNETVYQTINEIKNGDYYISFSYKKLIEAAIATLKINDIEIPLTEQFWKEESKVIKITQNQIKISITSNISNSVLITDLILSEGTTKSGWSQNANESYTDNVQIGKGVKITATGSDTEFVAEARGITIQNTDTKQTVAEFTKYGTNTEQLVAKKSIELEKALLIQKIGNQTWFSSL